MEEAKEGGYYDMIVVLREKCNSKGIKGDDTWGIYRKGVAMSHE